ncbi:small multidrug resistance pump [Bacillus ectoiniformans]|uniref:DMT family transporter n=1 Tax=Bacillus ectoiniformans TaxID=1494429 RepID=UPI00195B8126|nr:multidrug efflux SMR transporter [Bacillus ectoiniformans]MBM7650142.1 small multidrug resistance pump [Bacillus ectoiniformans]
MPYIFLAIAIICEVIGSSMLKMSSGFTKWWPSLIVFIGYGTAFYLLSLSLKSIPLSVAYAIWSGVGTALTALIGIYFWKEAFTLQTFLGLTAIIAGVVLLNYPVKN